MQMQPRYTKVSAKDDEDVSLLPSSSSLLKQRAMHPTPKTYRNQPEDLRFEEMQSPIPYKSILLAIFLAVFGINCFVLAWMHWTQQLLGKEQAELGFMFLGLMTFIPGAYHCRLAWGAWRGERGYCWELIPDI
jgi:hypothetical protein